MEPLQSKPASKVRTSYRPEIDGLRAVSVLGVVFFHAGLGFSGGYVGVDVFFVISGFLITSIILKDLQAGTFTLSRFWARRIRRILPAVSFMVGLVLVSGYFLLQPSDYRDLASSSVYQSLMIANVYFLNDTGYFAEISDFKPLLHTWTLAVEEQFYIFFPLLLALIYKLQRKRVFLLLGIIAAFSLAAGIYRIDSHPFESFFLLPTRAWELLIGALLAVSQHKLKFSARTAEVLSCAGLVMIFAAMLCFDAETPFPGSMALLPVLGAVAFIAGSGNRSGSSVSGVGGDSSVSDAGGASSVSGVGGDSSTDDGGGLPFAAKLLSAKPMVFLGLISYSLYLWHWPLFSFSKHVWIDVTLQLRVTLVFASIVLAYLSWKFIENPFRKKGAWISSHKATFSFGCAAVVTLFFASHLIRSLDGIPQRFNTEELVLIDDIHWKGMEFLGKKVKPVPIGAAAKAASQATPDFFLWGDSHGLMMSNIIDKKAKEYQLVGESHLVAARLPVPGLWRPSATEDDINICRKQNRRILNSIIQRGIPNVILVGRWSVNCSGQNTLEGTDPNYVFQSLVTDSPTITVDTNSPELATASLERRLNRLLQRFTNAGIKVWLVEQVPETNTPTAARSFFLAHRFPLVNKLDAFTSTREQHQRRQANAQAAFAGLNFPPLTVVDPAPLFFDNPQGRLHAYSEHSHYRDDDHLTRYGAELFLGPMFDRIFSDMSE